MVSVSSNLQLANPATFGTHPKQIKPVEDLFQPFQRVKVKKRSRSSKSLLIAL